MPRFLARALLLVQAVLYALVLLLILPFAFFFLADSPTGNRDFLYLVAHLFLPVLNLVLFWLLRRPPRAGVVVFGVALQAAYLYDVVRHGWVGASFQGVVYTLVASIIIGSLVMSWERGGGLQATR